MNRAAFWILVLIGLAVGRIFAEGERPFKVSNTVRVTYSDNYDHGPDNNQKDKTITSDTVALSFLVGLSDRTQLTFKSQFEALDIGNIYPNLYTTLGHDVSPRLFLNLSEYYSSATHVGDDPTTLEPENKKRYDHSENRVGASADYVLTQKDRLQASLNYDITRNDKRFDLYDNTTIGSGLLWKRELVKQRTFSTLTLNQSRVSQDHATDNKNVDTTKRRYFGDDAFYDQTKLTAGLNHTFNPEWVGNVNGGMTRTQNHNSDYAINYPTFSPPAMEDGNNDTYLDPVLGAGLSYTPSPGTQLSADWAIARKKVDDRNYTSQNASELSFSAQHEITAKLKALAKVSFSDAKLDADTATTTAAKSAGDEQQKSLDLSFRLTYQVHRMHFLDAGVQHKEVERDVGTDWTENRVDIGWRMDLN